MTKHSRPERDQRQLENQRLREIETAWLGSLPTATRTAYAEAVKNAHARGPLPRPPEMAPGTRPNPPRPGHEPRPNKEEQRRPKRY